MNIYKHYTLLIEKVIKTNQKNLILKKKQPSKVIKLKHHQKNMIMIFQLI